MAPSGEHWYVTLFINPALLMLLANIRHELLIMLASPEVFIGKTAAQTLKHQALRSRQQLQDSLPSSSLAAFGCP